MSSVEGRMVSLWVLGMSTLVFFAQTRGFHLLFDGLTYAALARNILRTGDWAHLHYGLEQYPDFYQHPPLAIWLQACVYKVFGFSEPVSRIIPAFLAVGSTWLVFLIGRRRVGLSAGIFSSLVLMSSTRFVKWGSNFYLDGILAFFSLLAATLLLFGLSDDRLHKYARRGLLFLGGVSLASAFMVKGIAALPGVGACTLIFFFFARGERFFEIGFFKFGAILPLFIWVVFGGGYDFLLKYFEVSVSGRTNFQQFSPHPWRNLYLLWLPWFPVFVLSIYSSVRGIFRGESQGRDGAVWAISALMVPVAYSFGTSYLEHYITPFYPFASVAVGMQLARWFPTVTERGFFCMKGLFIAAAVFLATFAPDVNEQKPVPADLWIQQVRTLRQDVKDRVKQIAFTERAGELWINLATLLGRGDGQAIGSFRLNRPPIPGTILVTKADEVPTSEEWAPISCLFLRDYRFFSGRNENYCD